MYLVYTFIGIFIATFVFLVYKPTVRFVKNILTRNRRITLKDMKDVTKEISKLHDEIGDIRLEVNLIKEVNEENKKNNSLLYPEHFEHDETTNKTVFVKDGEEKPYETISWRDR